MTVSSVPRISAQIPSLDGIRAVSIVIVFLSHVGFGGLIPGGFGVTVFFFLSGFLITTLLMREYDRNGKIAMPAFYMRRVIRLAPPILITLLLAAILVALGTLEGEVDPATLSSQILFYYNYFSLYGDRHEIFGSEILWSLSVEEHFYLIWPALFVLFARRSIGIGHVIGLVVGILIWRFVRVFVFGSDELAIYVSTDTRLDSLLFGCLLALMNWRGLSVWVFPQTRLRHGVMLGAVALLLLSFAVREEVFRSTLRYTLQGVALMPLFYYAVTQPESPYFRPLSWGFVKRIGVYSYTIYLCHFIIIIGLVYWQVAEVGSLLLLVLAGALSVGFAAAVYQFAERPMLPLRLTFSE